MIHIESYILLKEFQTNTYLVFDDTSKEAMLIDPSAPNAVLRDSIGKRELKLKMVANTHGHGDHIGGNDYFANDFECDVAIHAEDANMLVNNKKNFSQYMGMDLQLSPAKLNYDESFVFYLGKHKVRIIHTPGHTRGSVCLLVDKYLISGDTLFEQSIGRTDLPGGDHESIIKSIKNKLFCLSDEVLVYPGHGPATSIGLEKATNPFIRG